MTATTDPATPVRPTNDLFPDAPVAWTKTDRPTQSMWGPVQTAEELAPGIWTVTTAGHGGYLLSPERNARVHDSWRAANRQYEEDGDYCVVVHTFPEVIAAFGPSSEGLTDEQRLERCRQNLRDWKPDAWEAVTGESCTALNSRKRREQAFAATYAERLVVTGAWGDWAAWVPDGLVGCLAYRGGHAARTYRDESWFLVPAAEYRQKNTFGFVIDETRHQRIEKPENPSADKVRPRNAA